MKVAIVAEKLLTQFFFKSLPPSYPHKINKESILLFYRNKQRKITVHISNLQVNIALHRPLVFLHLFFSVPAYKTLIHFIDIMKQV